MSQDFSSVFGCSASPERVLALSWLWDDRPGEVVTPGPLYQTPRGACRAVPAWEDLASVMGNSQFDAAYATISTMPSHGKAEGESWSHTTQSYAPMAPFYEPMAPPYDPMRPVHYRRPRRRRHHVASLHQAPPELQAKPSSLTLAQLEVSPPGSWAMWRGFGLQASLHDREWQSRELAKHRFESRSLQAARDRANSKAYRDRTAAPSMVLLGGVTGSSPNGRMSTMSVADTLDRGATTTLPETQDSPHKRGSSKMEPQRRASHDSGYSPSEQSVSGSDLVKKVRPKVQIADLVEDDSPSQSLRGARKSAHNYKNQAPGMLTDGVDSPTRSSRASPLEGDENPGHQQSPQASPGKKSTLMKSRMRRLLETRKQDFASWPPSEQTRLRQAFGAGDPNGLDNLDARGLGVAFGELGIRGRTREEKETIWLISREAEIKGSINFFDFVFQIVSEVEQRLEELRSPELYKLFQKFDANSHGRLKESQCLEALEEHANLNPSNAVTFQAFWAGFIKEFPAIYRKTCIGLELTVELKTFQVIVKQFDSKRAEFQAHLEKRISTVEQLSPELQSRHNGELCVLKHWFDENDSVGADRLSVTEVTDAILQSGVTPAVGPIWARLQSVMDDCDGVLFGFKEFLQVTGGIRDDSLDMLTGSIQRLFKQYQWVVAPQIRTHDVPGLMVELELCKDCCVTVEDLAGLVEKCDNHECGDLQIADLASLCLKVSEKCRILQRESEAVVIKQLGFSKLQVLRLREAFASLSDNGRLGVSDVKRWFKEINPDVKTRTADIEALMNEACPQSMGSDSRKGSFGKEIPVVHSVTEDQKKAEKEANAKASEDGFRSGRGPSKSPSSPSPSSPRSAHGKSASTDHFHLEVDAGKTPRKLSFSDTIKQATSQAAVMGEKKVAEPDEEDFGEESSSDDEEVHAPTRFLYFDGYMKLTSLIMKA